MGRGGALESWHRRAGCRLWVAGQGRVGRPAAGVWGACAGAKRSLPHRHATPGVSQVRKVAEQNGVDVSSQIKELEARARQVSRQGLFCSSVQGFAMRC